MKRLLFSFLFVLMAIAGWAQTTFTQGDFTYTVTDEDAKTVSIAEAEAATLTGAITIPSSVTYETVTYTVTSIADYGFGSNEDITEVTIPNTVTSIGEGAFYNCSELTTITLPSTLTTIGNYAFWNCSSLTSFSVPGSVTTIGAQVFDYCSIPTFTFEASNTAITYNSGIPCTNHLYLYRDIIKDGALTDGYVKSLTIGANVTTINENMFQGCTYLSSIDFSEATGLTSIGDYAFYNCGAYVPTEPGEDPVPNLTTIDLSNTKVTSIGENAFNSCSKLETITLPSTLESIGNYAFQDCRSLVSFSLPGSVTTISSDAFFNCSIPTFTFEASNTTLTWNTTVPCSGHLYLYRNIDLVDGYMPNGLKAVTIGENVTGIGTMFYEAAQLENVYVPWLSSLINIADDAFCETTYTSATLWIPGGTGDIYDATDGWKNFTKKDFSSFVVKITGSAHGTLEVGDISSTNNETATTLIDRGEDAVFTVTPATGYELTTFTVNGEAKTPTEGQYTVSNLLADQTAVATYSPIAYTLSYTLAGGTVASANPTSYTIESAAITLNNPTCEGYTFAGWTGTGLDAATTAVTIAAGSTGNRSYTATWTPIIYNIALTLNGGTADNPATYTIESAAITLNNPTREGYTFAGWKLNGEGDALMSVTIVAGSTGNKAYTATWTPVSYTISYDLAGGSVASANPTSYNIESEDITLNNPTKDHYNFAGWTGTGLDAATESVTITTGSTGNRSYTATWTKKTYMVTITGGGVTADNDNPQYGENVVLTIMDDPDATLASLTVNGNNVTNEIEDNQYTIENVSGNVSVVATWSSTKEFITLAHAQATFSCDRDLDFSEVSGLKAYIASGFNRSTGTVLLTRVESVPAGTGLLLVGTEGATYKVPYAESTSFFVNLLQPVLDAQVVPATVSTYTNFLYGEKEGVQGFYKSSGEGTVSAKKAYLQLPTAALGGGSSVRVAILFDDADEDEETAIKDMQMANGDEAVYNLNGLRVANKRDMNRLPKGIYIIGGRKVTLK